LPNGGSFAELLSGYRMRTDRRNPDRIAVTVDVQRLCVAHFPSESEPITYCQVRPFMYCVFRHENPTDVSVTRLQGFCTSAICARAPLYLELRDGKRRMRPRWYDLPSRVEIEVVFESNGPLSASGAHNRRTKRVVANLFRKGTSKQNRFDSPDR
jgi:hypothetical protein